MKSKKKLRRSYKAARRHEATYFERGGSRVRRAPHRSPTPHARHLRRGGHTHPPRAKRCPVCGV